MNSSNHYFQSTLGQDIQDPTDFPAASNAPGLRDLDESLRCKICSEIYSAPMSLNCGHSFCSLCIRSHLSEKPECPICRQSSTDFNLRRNQSLEDVVRAWTVARPFVLGLCKDIEACRNDSISKTPSPSRRRSPSKPTPRKRKRSSYSDDDNDVVELVGSQLEESQIDDKSSRSRKAERSRDVDMDKEIVNCPICDRQVPLQLINTHIDNRCRDISVGESSTSRSLRSKQKKDWEKFFLNTSDSSVFTRPKGKERAGTAELDNAEPIPKASYHTIKDKRIREMLSEFDLPTTGDKETLAARHQRWVILYNANLDNPPTHRKSLDQLRQELKEWEKHQRAGKNHVVTDVEAYQRDHKGHFDALVAAARPKKRHTSGSEKEKSSHRPSPPVSEEDVVIIDVDETR